MKRKTKEAKAPPQKEMPPAAVSAPQAVPEKKAEAPMKAPEAPKKETPPLSPTQKAEPQPKTANDSLKVYSLIALFIVAVILAYYFLVLSENTFVTGSGVDMDTFKGIFMNASNVYIVMDVRGASDDVVSNNIIQCGVDFAGSSGMGGKMVTPMSIYDGGCIAPDGNHTVKECYGMLKDGIAIYVKEGPGGGKFYSNGMVVTVGQNYTTGTCGIRWT